MQWLKKNSRELFGNIIEKKVVLLVDTSSSMEAKLYQVKRGLCKVIQEQLNERETFNVVHFNSKVHMWKNEMMECCSRNFEDAIVWVKSLFASGSTNTLEALQMCYGLNDIEAIYLLSDGRPDQHCEEILTQVNPKIPIHAISYNCDDEQANEFLYELSKQTSGRYHCFFENEFFVGEKFQSEDLYLIKKEIKRAHRELEKISLLHKIIQQKKTVERNIFFEPNKLKSRPASAYVDNKSSLLRTKQFNENEDKQNDVQIKKKKKKENENEIKKWIKRYGLKACKLTIIDALAPTIISRKPAYIPVLGKDVLSKVFGEALPIINTSGGINKELQVVNPQVIDLDSYEEKLNNWFKVITRKMISYILLKIPVEAKEKLEVDNVYEYSEYKDILFQSIDENDSTNKIRDNLVLLESELERGRVFLKQSTDLKEIIKQMEKETKNEVEESNSSSKIANKDVGNTGNPLRFRYHRVLARNDFDGLYYLALVKKYLNSRFVNVCFDNGEEQIISVRYVISVGGSRPCPLLKAGDYVLAKCQTQDSLNGDENCYKPAIVQVIPHEAKSSLKFYTVVTYDGFKITLLRKDMTKINRSRFVFTVRFIQEATILANNKLRTSFQESNETYLLSQESSEAFEKSDKDSDDVSSPSEHGEQDLYDIVSVHSESDMGDEVKKIDTNHDMIQENNENHIKNDRNSSLNVDATDFFDILSEQLQTNNQNELFEINLSVNGKSEADSTVIKENYNIETQQSISLELLEEYQQKIKKKQQDMEMEFDAKFHELTEQRSALHKMEEVLYEKVMHQTEQQAVFQLQLYDILKHQESLLQKQVHIQNEETQNKKDTDSDGSAVYLQLTKELLSHQEQLIKQILENQKNQLPQQTKVVQEKDEEKKETFDNTFCFSPLPSVEIKDNITEDISLKDIPWTGSSTPSDICNSSSDTVKNTDSLEKHHKIGSDEHSSELKVFVHPMSEAVLLAQGESGLFVSRVPLESDPAVKVCCVPSVLNMGEEVLARFHSDGWYYRGTVRKFLSNTTYIIEDSFGDICKIERADIISDEDDADNIIQTGSYVIGLYPNFYFSYAPGVVASIEADGAINVQFYDGQISFVPRSEVYLTTFSKFESDVAMIRQREDALVGQAVVTRDNKTGKYHLAAVRSRIAGSRNYLIEWSDQTLELQNYVFIFGSHSRHRNIKKNSHCLAIIDKDNFTYLPATVEGKKGNELSVIFCNSNTVKTVESAHAFWISEHFYKEAVTYWESKNNSTT